jgi:hypothetical protein
VRCHEADQRVTSALRVASALRQATPAPLRPLRRLGLLQGKAGPHRPHGGPRDPIDLGAHLPDGPRAAYSPPVVSPFPLTFLGMVYAYSYGGNSVPTGQR